VLSCERILVARASFASSQDLETQFRFPQASTDIQDVVRSRSRSQHGGPGPDFAHDSYIDKNLVSPCRVTACQRALEPARGALQTPEEQIQPSAGVRLWQGQTQQEAAGRAPHRRYIAQCSGEALPTHGIRRMLVPQEVCAFQEPVAAKDDLVAGLCPEKRGVIADSQCDGVPRPLAMR
jgi:hypothetical protein